MEPAFSLDFSEPILYKLLYAIFVGIVGTYIVMSWFNGWICAWWIIVVGLLNWLLSTPDVIVQKDGLHLRRFGVVHFVPWDDIYYISSGIFYTRVKYRGIPLALKVMLLYNGLTLVKWRRNYQEATVIIHDKLDA